MTVFNPGPRSPLLMSRRDKSLLMGGPCSHRLFQQTLSWNLWHSAGVWAPPQPNCEDTFTLDLSLFLVPGLASTSRERGC